MQRMAVLSAQQTLTPSAANDRFEPKSTDAALIMNGGKKGRKQTYRVNLEYLWIGRTHVDEKLGFWPYSEIKRLSISTSC